jgi:branched-subunit amino acid ABC-type transport system permease component
VEFPLLDILDTIKQLGWSGAIELFRNGLTLGSLYALIALGYSMVYGILKLLNFAHGDVYMIGAFLGYGVLNLFGGPLSPNIALAPLIVLMFLGAMLGAGLLGVLIERFAYRPLRDAPRIAPLISALGVSFFLQNSVLLLFGSQFRTYNSFLLGSAHPEFFEPGPLIDSVVVIHGVKIQLVQVLVLAMSVGLMIALTLLVSRTRIGKAMRATSFDREAAAMMGIDVDRVIASTFFIGRRGPGRHRQHPRGDARWAARRPCRVVCDRVCGRPLVGLDRLCDPDLRPPRATERPARCTRDPQGLMASGGEIPSIPARPDERDRLQVGVDEWVAQVEERRVRQTGLAGLVRRGVAAVPPPARLAVFAALAASLPLWMNRADVFSYGIFTLLYILLGLGLNVVVGYAGLLDLGYVAFFGFGAYLYAELSSAQYGIHWPSVASVPVVLVSAALMGLVLGIPSRRLLGDYLAIVTLFFGQAFVVFVNAANPTVAGKGLTGGPNGIADIDPLDLFGYELTTRARQFYFLLVAVVLVLIGLHFLSESRTGRAWRALREDPLAAEAMSMPVNRLKLMAFAFGAAIAGLAGCIFASTLTAVTSGKFDLPILITVYAVVILGGFGSLTGVVLGAIVINVSFQFLAPENPQNNARVLFYLVVLLLLVQLVRPWWRLGVVIGAVVALGLVTQALVDAVAPSWTGGAVVEGGRLGGVIGNWVIIPSGHGNFGDFAYVTLVALVLILTRLHGLVRTIAIVPTLYLAAIVWENSFVENPAVARWILFGSLLVALMTVRPQGLLGTPRVEIV